MISWNAAGAGFVASATSVLVALLIPHELCEAEVARGHWLMQIQV